MIASKHLIVSLTLFLLFVGDTWASLSQCFSKQSPSVSCKESNPYLSNLYPANGIFVGLDFNYYVDNMSFLKELLELAGEDRNFPPINILLPKSYLYFKGMNKSKIEKLVDKRDIKTGMLYLRLLRLIKDVPKVNLIETQDERTLWAQDIFELHFVENQKYLHNFRKKYSYDYAKVLRKQCKIKTKEIKLSTSPVNLGSRQYEDGGNFESLLGVALIGNTMSPEMKSSYKRGIKNVLELDVGSFSVGHIDEILQVIPSSIKGDCGNMVLVYPSPKLALKLLEKEKKPPTSSCHINMDGLKGEIENAVFDCPKFYVENKELDEIILKEIEKVVQLVKKEKKCSYVNMLPLPALFFRNFNKPRKNNGLKQNRFRPLYPNLVNSTIINKYLILPKQTQVSFQEYAKKKIEKIGLIPKFLDVSFVNEDDGGVHCLLNVSRECKTAPLAKRRKKKEIKIRKVYQ